MEQAKQDREEHAQLFKDAAAHVSQEAHRRDILEAKRVAIEDQAKANLLCLKETSAEEEKAAWEARMEKQREEHKAELKAMEARMEAISERQMQTFKLALEDR